MRIVLHARARLDLAYDSLEGLSVGDALGAQFFMAGRSFSDLVAGRPPAGPWEWTDDTEMACNLVAELRDRGEVDQDRLAQAVAHRCEPYRGYGAGAFVILHQIRDGVPWRSAAGAAFKGQGSCGNGAAMRVAPLGAYYADDLRGVAVAVASAVAAHARLRGTRPAPRAFLDAVLDHLDDGQVRKLTGRARSLLGKTVGEVAYELGNGSGVTAQDTVPFTLWAGGDVDTTAAIVGGVVGRPPAEWLAAREPLPDWVSR